MKIRNMFGMKMIIDWCLWMRVDKNIYDASIMIEDNFNGINVDVSTVWLDT